MKKVFIASLTLTFILVAGTERALALSCLPTDMYLADVVGNEQIVIFEATSLERIEEKEHTIEILEVTDAKQGWVEEKIFAYHEKSQDWGYLCNQGPQSEGSTGLYVATRNNQGQYTVYQRLDHTDPLVAGLETDLESAEIEGGIGEISSKDRMNQIVTGIQELLKQIKNLLEEYSYWKNQ